MMNKISRINSIDNVAETILKEKTYGDEISYEYMENLIELDRTDFAFFYIICKVKEILIDHGYVLKNTINEGYRILYPNEISDEVVKRYVLQSTGKLEIAKRIMENTEIRMLNKAERETFNYIQNLVHKELISSTNTLACATAYLNDVKQKELSK